MFFDQLGLWSSFQDANILHFAPEPHLADRIAAQHPKLYIKADLHPAMPDIHSIDVTDIHYDDNSFDVIVCNHVLEHLSNDTKGMSELYRVLRPGGWAVLQTPYSRLLQNTFCDPAIQTNQLRKRLYGQEDHVRLYGADLLSKLAQAGFDPCVKAHGDVLAGIDANIDGVNPREDLLLFTKNTVIP
jgi:SAM-dependent methyltransferase